jgi:hypothetical protein
MACPDKPAVAQTCRRIVGDGVPDSFLKPCQYFQIIVYSRQELLFAAVDEDFKLGNTGKRRLKLHQVSGIGAPCTNSGDEPLKISDLIEFLTQASPLIVVDVQRFYRVQSFVIRARFLSGLMTHFLSSLAPMAVLV